MPTPVKSLPPIAPGRGRKARPEYAEVIGTAVAAFERGSKAVTLDQDDLAPLDGLMQNRKVDGETQVIEVSDTSKNAGLRSAASRVTLAKGKHKGKGIEVSFRNGEVTVSVEGELS